MKSLLLREGSGASVPPAALFLEVSWPGGRVGVLAQPPPAVILSRGL